LAAYLRGVNLAHIQASGRSQVFDDERLLVPAFPFLAALAGIGFDWVFRGLKRRMPQGERSLWMVPLTVGLVIFSFVPELVHAFLLYPHLLSYYSEGIAGLRGARRLGLETTYYWCESYQDSLDYLNTHAPEGALVWAECRDVMLYY
jgi:hypothetical protein